MTNNPGYKQETVIKLQAVNRLKSERWQVIGYQEAGKCCKLSLPKIAVCTRLQ